MISANKSGLKVAHVTSWLSRQGGGIPPVIGALARETRSRGHEVSVFGLNDPWVENDCKGNYSLPETGNIVGPKFFGFSPQLKKNLHTRVGAPGIVHSHGLWMYPGFAARKCATEKNCRLMISPHGMLEPWALKNSGWKKQLAGRLFENKNLQSADCLHALCRAEAENFRRYGLKNPIAVIPNGVDAQEFSVSPNGSLEENFPETQGRRRILFLSRLHPKKGLSNLLQAWKKMARDFDDWQLLVAGDGEPAYEAELKTFAEHLISEKRVLFTGAIYGEMKKQMLASSDIFVLPSFSEGFSMAILEAAAAALPVLLTRECNFPELAKVNAAVEIPPDVPAIENGLRQLLNLSDAERKAMGNAGRELVQKFYTWPVVAEQMCEVYNWLAGNSEMPKTINVI